VAHNNFRHFSGNVVSQSYANTAGNNRTNLSRSVFDYFVNMAEKLFGAGLVSDDSSNDLFKGVVGAGVHWHTTIAGTSLEMWSVNHIQIQQVRMERILAELCSTISLTWRRRFSVQV
jgi:hypothetical protein